jgi:hypothetical protein
MIVLPYRRYKRCGVIFKKTEYQNIDVVLKIRVETEVHEQEQRSDTEHNSVIHLNNIAPFPEKCLTVNGRNDDKGKRYQTADLGNDHKIKPETQNKRMCEIAVHAGVRFKVSIVRKEYQPEQRHECKEDRVHQYQFFKGIKQRCK